MSARDSAATHELRDEVQRLIERGRLPQAVSALEELERREPDDGRWPQKRGDVLRRMGDVARTAEAYELAAKRYARQGFVARAVAMAKTIAPLDADKSAAVLAAVDPAAAKDAHRAQRPRSVSALADASAGPARERGMIAAAPPLRASPDEASDETRFGDAPESSVFELELAELEPIEVSAASAPPPPPPRDDASEAVIFVESDPSIAALEVEIDAFARDDAPPELGRLAALPGFPLFAELSREHLTEIARAATLLEVARGARVVSRGESADALYAIVTGSVRVRLAGGDVILGEGDVFGESALLTDGTRNADVIAESGSTLLSIPKRALDVAMAADPAIHDVLHELLARRLLANLLSTSPLFAAFDTETRRDLARLAEVRTAEAGSTLLARGKRADALYVVLAGSLEVERDGERVVAGGGTILGQTSLLERAPSPIEVRARGDALVLRLPAAQFGRLAALYPPAMAYLGELALT